MNDLLTAVARRLKLAWSVATGQLLLPTVAAVALVLVLVGFRRPWAWLEPGAFVVVVGSAVALVAVGSTLRVPVTVAARAADRGLDTKDAFASALQFQATPDDGLHPHVLRRAQGLAAGARAEEAVPLRWSRRPLVVGAALVAAAVGLSFAPNHQDDVRAQQARERAAIEAAADDLREEAAAIRDDPGAGAPEEARAERLEQLADELTRAETIEEAAALLAEAEAELNAEVSAGLESQRTAALGLERSLEDQPLPGSDGGDAAEQLQEAAEAAASGGLSPEEAAALAEQLQQLAEGQQLANPELAQALQDAAAGLASGDAAGASAALGEAAAAQAGAVSDIAAQDGAASDATAVGDAAAGLGQAGEPGQGQPGQGPGDGQGDGDGDGEGDGNGDGNGNGQGNGDGQGQGQGNGGGQGQGNGAGSGASGNVGGSNASNGSGQGGVGRPNGSGDNPSGGLDESGDETTVYEPGDQLDAGGSTNGSDPGETVGQGNTGSNRNRGRVPLSQVLAEYRSRATASLDRADIPPSLRNLVRDYFDNLAAGDQEN